LIQDQYHTNNLFHGDIKPDNIFFDDEFFIITSDVGSVMHIGERDEESKNPNLF
jgi:serine/threonine protein kinase